MGACRFGMCLSLPSSGDLVGRRAMCALWEHVAKCRPLCVVMSPTDSRLLDLVLESATTQLRNGRQFVCITLTDSSLNYKKSLKALRSIRGVLTVVADGCAFGCRCVGTEHLVAAGFCSNLRERCSEGMGGHIHVQRTPDQQMPVRVRRGVVTSIRQTRDRLESVCGSS